MATAAPANKAFLKVCRLSENAILPKKMTPGAVGFDLFSPREMVLPPGDQQLGELTDCIQCPANLMNQNIC